MIFKEEEVTDNLVNYIVLEARALYSKDLYSVQNYVDRQVNHPEMVAYLQSDKMIAYLKNVQTKTLVDKPLSLGFEARVNLVSDSLETGFQSLKDKIRQVFCAVTKDLDLGSTTVETIVKLVLVALIPILGATGGLAAIVLPIIIGLVYQLLKYGYDQVCPIQS